jgi:ATP-dependent protease ClpP protease subunit
MMQNKVFQEIVKTAIVSVEKSLETKLEFTNHNGIEFSIVIAYNNENTINLYIKSEGDIAIAKTFYDEKNPTIDGVADAVLSIYEYIEENKQIDHWDVVEMLKEAYDYN